MSSRWASIFPVVAVRANFSSQFWTNTLLTSGASPSCVGVSGWSFFEYSRPFSWPSYYLNRLKSSGNWQSPVNHTGGLKRSFNAFTCDDFRLQVDEIKIDYICYEFKENIVFLLLNVVNSKIGYTSAGGYQLHKIAFLTCFIKKTMIPASRKPRFSKQLNN